MLPTPNIRSLNHNVYEPSEDSFLLLDCFEQERNWLNQKFHNQIPLLTEIGTGSGIVTSFLISNILPNSISLTTDINPHATVECKKTMKYNNPDFTRFDSLQMNLTHGIIHKSIDVLVFNPPYVPAETVPKVPDSEDSYEWLDLALLGGSDGMVVTWELLDLLDTILSSQGVAYILFCARNKPESVQKIMESRGWGVEEVINRKAGWEVLSILKFYRKS